MSVMVHSQFFFVSHAISSLHKQDVFANPLSNDKTALAWKLQYKSQVWREFPMESRGLSRNQGLLQYSISLETLFKFIFREILFAYDLFLFVQAFWNDGSI